MIIPPKINIGDKIGIVAPARKITSDLLDPAIDILRSWGLEVVLGSFIFEEDNQFSGTIHQRTISFQKMLDDPSINAVLCARGGYGTVQLIDKIDFTILTENPKWIIGYSDITVLHSHLNKIGLSSLHATMPINFISNSKKSLNSLKKSLFGHQNIIKFQPHSKNQYGRVNAEIVGGNLSILYSLLGSNSDVDTDGKILFIEDLDEYLYHIDRMVISMKRNRKFVNLKAMIIGEMSHMNDNDIPFGKTIEEIIIEHVKEYNFPLCFGFPCGHLDDNRSLRLGSKSVLEINENGCILLQN